MKRRDALKYLLAAPAAVAIPAALAAPRDFDTANMTARMTYYAPLLPGGWKCVNGHPYCNRCVTPVDLSEESMEQLCRDIEATLSNTGKPIAITPTHVHLREHRMKPDTYICEDCGASEEEIENGDATKFCPGPLDEDAGLFGFGEP